MENPFKLAEDGRVGAGDLGAGAVAGIVAGAACLLGLAVAAAVFFYRCRRRRRKKVIL